MKRTFDSVVSCVVLLAALPLFGLIALAIRVDSPGPVLYRGRRIGLFGRPFGIYKFRTMVAGACRFGTSTPADDPRITSVGAFLRRWKLDEIPQLLNILRGEMSLVGPRPQVAWAVAQYTSIERVCLLQVRPGLTDPASLRFHNEGEFLRGSTDPDREYMEQIHPEKMRLSLQYVAERSFLGDIGLLLRTLLVVVKKDR